MNAPSKIPWVLIAFLAIALVVEVTAYCFAPVESQRDVFTYATRSPQIEESIVEAKLIAATRPNQQTDIIILGDSSGLMGVQSDLLANQLNCQVFNLATVSWVGVQGNQLLLDEWMRSNASPKVVIYHFAPNELGHTSELIDQYGYVTRMRAWLRLQSPGGNRDETPESDHRTPAQILEDYSRYPTVLPSQSYREHAQRWLTITSDRERHGTETRGGWPSHVQMIDNILSQQGYFGERTLPKWDQPPRIEGELSKTAAESLTALAAELDRRGTILILVMNPLPEIARSDSTTAAIDRLQRQLLNVTNAYDSSYVMLPAPRYYPNDELATLNHLTPSAAKTNTLEIAATIQKVAGIAQPPRQASPNER